ncbi:hypothetical protein [Staphylococcus sp. 11261D007BR]
MKIIFVIVIGIVFGLIDTFVKWLDGKYFQKKTGKSARALKNDKKHLIISFCLFTILGLIVGWFSVY